MTTRIESRTTRTDVAVETALGELPVAPHWKTVDLNSYSDAQVEITNTARSVMTSGRGVREGTPTDLTAGFGYNIDNTGDNVLPQICAFMFSVPKERASRSVLAGAPKITLPTLTITAITADSVTLSAAPPFAVNDIVVSVDGVNNRAAQVVTAVAGNKLTLAPIAVGAAALTVPAAIPSDARVIKVGVRAAVQSTLTGAADKVTLQIDAATITALNVESGEWIFVGGDSVGTRFASTEPFYARVSVVEATTLTFDATTRPVPLAPETAATLDVYLGTHVKDGEDSISFTYSRYLGKDGDNKNMRESFRGSMASEMALNMEAKSLVTCDFTYMCMDGEMVSLDDAAHNALYADTVEADDGSGISTVTDVYRQRLVIPKLGVVNPAAIHAFVKTLTMNVQNNLTLDDAQGVLGAIGASAGDFVATGSMQVYLVSSQIREAMRCNCTAALDIICARKNAGFVLDVPALKLSNGSINIEKGQSVTIDLDKSAFESSRGYTMSYTNFHYIPAAAMPEGSTGCDC